MNAGPRKSGRQAQAAPSTLFQIEIDGHSHRLELKPSDSEGGYTAILDGNPIQVDGRMLQPGVMSLIVDGHAYRCILDEALTETAIRVAGTRYPYSVEDPRSLSARRGKLGAAGGRQTIKAPMPGRIVRLLVETGDQIAAHQGVVVIEAMKMQNELKASRAGKVVEIRVAPGATVAAGEVLLVIE